jgi:hypothetical protein
LINKNKNHSKLVITQAFKLKIEFVILKTLKFYVSTLRRQFKDKRTSRREQRASKNSRWTIENN